MRKLFTLLTLLVCLCTGAWADEVIFSMASVTNGKTSVPKGTTQSITATFNAGSSAEVYNGHGTDAKEMISSGGQIQLGGSGASYFHASFTTALAEGDVISCTGDASGTFYLNGTSSKSALSITFPYTIKSTDTGLTGKNDLYVWKDGGKNFTAFAITRITGTHAPSITQSGTSVTLECTTSGATIYYTTDGSEPTTSSATYSTAITLPNSCTVRAFAKKGDEASDLVMKDCYVSHASADGYITALGYNGGTVAGDVWTGTDFTITNNVEGRGINYADLAGSQDGFKLNHTDSYTIQPSEDVKVTKIVVVGKSWLKGNAGNASTIAFDDFTPASSTFYDYLIDGETYVKTVEFTPSAEQTYGQAITMRPGNNQLGAYIEVYGVKRNSPAAQKEIKTVTWDFTDLTAQSFTQNSSYSFKANDGTTEMRYSAGSNDAIVAKNGNTNGYLKENGTTSTSNSVVDIDGETVVGKNRLIRLYVSGKGKLTINCGSSVGVYTVKDGSTNGNTLLSGYTANNQSSEITVSNFLWIETTSKGYINSIVWTPSTEGVILTTTNNMAGWRAFYDASTGYTVDANTKIYIVTAKDETKATLAEVTGRIPAQTPVLLKTSADNRTMTLTKATNGDAIDATGNQLTVTDGTAVSNVYRLGYGEEGVGFYPYSATSPASGIVYLSAATHAKALMFSFGDETALDDVSADEKVNKGTGLMYNLNGQLVDESYEGIVIIDGKKYNK